jgi:hypothetical protein
VALRFDFTIDFADFRVERWIVVREEFDAITVDLTFGEYIVAGLAIDGDEWQE